MNKNKIIIYFPKFQYVLARPPPPPQWGIKEGSAKINFFHKPLFYVCQIRLGRLRIVF